MAKTWLVNSRVIAKKVKNATIFSSCPIEDGGKEAMLECPNCKHRIDNSDVSLEWPGLPAGVKFDPSDVELLEHLAGKIGHANSRPHVFIDEFIPTVREDEGICYTHPENLPGVKKDGSNAHFFHRTFNAYATGHRKRRKILNGHDLSQEHVRWHKTGKTRPVMENGIQKGFKKIMVLYKSSKKGLKPVKSNWVMHQYHLGTEDEGEGEFVVSKIFLQSQAKQVDKVDDVDPAGMDTEKLATGVSPMTPKTHTPYPPRAGKAYQYNEGDDVNVGLFSRQDKRVESQSRLSCMNIGSSSGVWAGESQAVEDPDPDDLIVSLMCDEVLDPLFPVECSDLKNAHYCKDFGRNDAVEKDNMLCGFPDLDNIDTDTPPDFNLVDLQFGSQDSLMSWLDRL